MRLLIILIWILTVPSVAQDIQVEPGKNVDWATHKTYRFGKSEIVTHKEDKKISDASLDKIIRETIDREMTIKGISRNDAAGTLVVTYLAGSFHHSELQRLGPLGATPGQVGANFSRDFDQGSLVIDINDSATGVLVWRVNSTVSTNLPDPRNNIEQVVSKGFKKFAVTPKKKRKS